MRKTLRRVLYTERMKLRTMPATIYRQSTTINNNNNNNINLYISLCINLCNNNNNKSIITTLYNNTTNSNSNACPSVSRTSLVECQPIRSHRRRPPPLSDAIVCLSLTTRRRHPITNRLITRVRRLLSVPVTVPTTARAAPTTTTTPTTTSTTPTSTTTT